MLTVVAGVIMVGITVSIPIDALMRSIFKQSISGLTDLVENGLMTAVLISAPLVLHKHAHVMVELISHALPAKPQFWLKRFVSLMGFIVSVVLTWSGANSLLSAYEHHTMVRKILEFPEWLTFIPLIICFALCAIEFLRQAAGMETPANPTEV